MPFPITCRACLKTFSIADDVFERKVKGRVVTIKCKQCQAGIRVDGTQTVAPSAWPEAPLTVEAAEPPRARAASAPAAAEVAPGVAATVALPANATTTPLVRHDPARP